MRCDACGNQDRCMRDRVACKVFRLYKWRWILVGGKVVSGPHKTWSQTITGLAAIPIEVETTVVIAATAESALARAPVPETPAVLYFDDDD